MECSNLEIRDIEIRICCSESRLAEGSLRSDSSGALNFLFLTATTSEGLRFLFWLCRQECARFWRNDLQLTKALFHWQKCAGP